VKARHLASAIASLALGAVVLTAEPVIAGRIFRSLYRHGLAVALAVATVLFLAGWRGKLEPLATAVGLVLFGGWAVVGAVELWMAWRVILYDYVLRNYVPSIVLLIGLAFVVWHGRALLARRHATGG